MAYLMSNDYYLQKWPLNHDLWTEKNLEPQVFTINQIILCHPHKH